MASPRTSSGITGLVHTYLDDIHKEDPSFFKNLANKPQMNGRLFFNLVLDNGTAIAFPNDENTSRLLTRADTASIDELINPRLTLSTVDTIQNNAADIFSMVRVSFLDKLTDLAQPERDRLQRILAGALCYKIWCIKNTNQTDIIKAKIVAATLSSTEDSSNTLHALSSRYSEMLKNKFASIFNSLDEYLKNKMIKQLLDTINNLKNAIVDLQTNVEFRCLNDDDQHQIHRHITFKLNKINPHLLLLKFNKDESALIKTALDGILLINADDDHAATIYKGHSIETSTPSSAASSKPSPRRQHTDASISPRSAAAAATAATSVAKSPLGFMSRGSVIQPKKSDASPRLPGTPTNSPRQ